MKQTQRRMTPSRKREILEAIENNPAYEAVVMWEHNISREEMDSWKKRFRDGGQKALRVTRKVKHVKT